MGGLLLKWQKLKLGIQWNLSTTGLRVATKLSATANTSGTEQVPYTYHC